MPDGDSLVVSGFDLPHFYAWRVSANKAAEPEQIEMAGADALWPAISRVGGRLAFARSILQADIWRLDRGGKPIPFLTSTARDTSPQFSTDGQRIAFQSARGGANDIWVAHADGTRLVQITRNLSENNGSPRWSPDGKWVAFDSNGKEGRLDVWIVEAEGGPPRQLTHRPGNNWIPSWSRDGKRVYFVSNRSGRTEIWRVHTKGGRRTDHPEGRLRGS
jgi:Tol biopolymer transport system component